MQEINKKSCWFFLLRNFTNKFFAVQVHGWEIEINLGSVVYSMTSDALTFTLYKFSMTIVFTYVLLEHDVKKDTF